MRPLLLVAALLTAAAPAIAAGPSEEAMSEGQLEASQRVFTGTADCEFKQRIVLTPVEGRPGHFRLEFNKARYELVPQETTTGAVRLEDRRAGIVWLQIPAKSMLMSSKLGQRLVDNCTHPQQRESVASTDTGLGVATAATASR